MSLTVIYDDGKHKAETAGVIYKKTKDVIERDWRDSELARTDVLMAVGDYPNKEALEIYRQSLRDYPSQPDFPNGTRPVE